MRYQNIQTSAGVFQAAVPNSVMDGVGFYVSYNDHDISVYGCDTTALVVGQMTKFFILKGDHRAQYSRLIGHGLEACMSYFKAHLAERHNHSDQLPEDGEPQL